jgi:hypothetical protein
MTNEEIFKEKFFEGMLAPRHPEFGYDAFVRTHPTLYRVIMNALHNARIEGYVQGLKGKDLPEA